MKDATGSTDGGLITLAVILALGAFLATRVAHDPALERAPRESSGRFTRAETRRHAGTARHVIDASVLVVGGGAIGGITAAKLTDEVRRVVVLDTNEEHVARLRDPGLTFEEEGAEHTVALDAVGSADDLDGKFDFALIAVKSPFHRAALEPLAATGKIAAFVSLGNGLIQDRMAEWSGADRLLSCIVEWGGTNLGPGRVVRDTIAPMVVGDWMAPSASARGCSRAAWEVVGDVRVTGNMRGQIWSKLLVNSSCTGLSAVSGLRYGGVAEHPDGRAASLCDLGRGIRGRRGRGRGARRGPRRRAARARRARRRGARANDGDRRQHQAVDAAGP